jgi:hypothetical protein
MKGPAGFGGFLKQIFTSAGSIALDPIFGL